jgi:cell division protein FtsB
MWTRQRKSRRYGALIVPTLSTVLIAYFAYHAFHGDYGINAGRELAVRTQAAQAELARIKDQRAAFEHRLAMLRDGSIERDMLDEHARRTLNVAREDEVVIYRRPVSN